MAEAAVAAVVVRNTANHDARVLRCARTLRTLGYEAVVIAVTSEEESAQRSVAEGVPILRVTPRAPLAGIARALRRAKSARTDTPLDTSTTNGNRPDGGRRLGRAVRAYRLLRTLSYYRRGIGAMRRLRPEIVHCNDYNTMWIGIAAKLLTGSALIYDSHELWPDRNGRSEPRWWLLTCEAFFLRIADGTLATSPGHAAEISRRHRVPPPQVVRNIAERPVGKKDGAGPSTQSTQSARTLVYVGAMTEGRGLEQAIAALPQAPGVTLRVLGPCSEQYRELLYGLAAEHEVGGRVQLEPPVSPQRLVEEIAAAAAGLALIQPTCLSYELSLPNKLFEYLAAGLPILATDLPTIRQFVEGNSVGLIVPPGDPAGIAQGMLEIIDPARNRQLRDAVAEVSAEISWAREAEGLKDAYRLASAGARS